MHSVYEKIDGIWTLSEDRDDYFDAVELATQLQKNGSVVRIEDDLGNVVFGEQPS